MSAIAPLSCELREVPRFRHGAGRAAWFRFVGRSRARSASGTACRDGRIAPSKVRPPLPSKRGQHITIPRQDSTSAGVAKQRNFRFPPCSAGDAWLDRDDPDMRGRFNTGHTRGHGAGPIRLSRSPPHSLLRVSAEADTGDRTIDRLAGLRNAFDDRGQRGGDRHRLVARQAVAGGPDPGQELVEPALGMSVDDAADEVDEIGVRLRRR